MPLPEQAIQDIHKIREALENIDQKSFPYPTSFNLEKFPKGCCGDTIDLIGYYLLKHYNIDSYFITKKGWKKDPEVNHAWLQYEGAIIDLTADQFNDEHGLSLPPVIIERDSDLHKSFKITEKEPQLISERAWVIEERSGIPAVLDMVRNKLK